MPLGEAMANAVKRHLDIHDLAGYDRVRLHVGMAVHQVREAACDQRLRAIWGLVDKQHRDKGLFSVCRDFQAERGLTKNVDCLIGRCTGE